MGSTIMFMALADNRNCMQNKVHSFVALAPAVFIHLLKWARHCGTSGWCWRQWASRRPTRTRCSRLMAARYTPACAPYTSRKAAACMSTSNSDSSTALSASHISTKKIRRPTNANMGLMSRLNITWEILTKIKLLFKLLMVNLMLLLLRLMWINW